MEDQVAELARVISQLTVQVNQQEAVRVQMAAEITALRGQAQQAEAHAQQAEAQAQQAAAQAGAGSSGPRVGIDTRNLGRPAAFAGTDAAWRDGSIVFQSYAALVNPSSRC